MDTLGSYPTEITSKEGVTALTVVDSDYEGEIGFLLIPYGQGGICQESTKLSGAI